MDNYFVLDIETCPVDLETYEALENEEEKLKMLNPINSKIIAIGIRHKGENRIFLDEDEKQMLEDFWAEWRLIQKQGFCKVVGFSINQFDLPFLTARSLINNVTIEPFVLKTVIDLRDKINAYRYGRTRGKLKEYAKLLGLETLDVDGSDVAGMCRDKDWDKIKEYLAKDLEITSSLYRRCKETRILEIERW